MGIAGEPAQGAAASYLLLHGEALQVLALESLMAGKTQS
jgi:hypothetical protein